MLVIPDVSKKWHHSGCRLSGQKWCHQGVSKQHWCATRPKK